MIGGDINSQRSYMDTELLRRGFTPVLPEGSKTMAKLVDEVSDHKLIKLVVGAEVRHKKD